jgi:outer membrane protein OmpA-like peptidoglycan-associated protein
MSACRRINFSEVTWGIIRMRAIRRRYLWAVAVVLVAGGLLLQPDEARAGGIRVKKWLDLPTLVKQSSVIVAGKVLSTSHVLHSRRAYGRRVTYMAVFRVHIRVQEVLRGPKTLKGRRALLTKTIYGVPGEWILVDRSYRSSLSPGNVKVGTRLLTFVLRSNKKGLQWPRKTTAGPNETSSRPKPKSKGKAKAKAKADQGRAGRGGAKSAKQGTPWIQAFALEHIRKAKKVRSVCDVLNKSRGRKRALAMSAGRMAPRRKRIRIARAPSIKISFYFPPRSVTPLAGSQTLLRWAVKALKKRSKKRYDRRSKKKSGLEPVEVAGYADDYRSPRKNMKLSGKRAEVIKKLLVKAGVPANLLEVKAYGAPKHLYRHEKLRSELRNRRVILRVGEK